MRRAITAALMVGTLCTMAASAQVPVPGTVPLDRVEAESQSWTFGTGTAVCDYQHDVGTSNTGVGWVRGELAWMNVFDAGTEGECGCITQIETRLSDANLVGRELKVFVWNDPTPDRDPSDAEFLGQGVAVANNTDLFSIDLNTPVEVTGHFWIAGVMWHEDAYDPPLEWPAPYDTTQVSFNRAWMAVNDPLFEYNDLTLNQYMVPVNTWPGQFPDGVWLLRPILGTGCGASDPCDMNCDGTVDAGDIENFIGLLFEGDEPCAPGTGDVNGDGRIDAGDIEGFINCLFP